MKIIEKNHRGLVWTSFIVALIALLIIFFSPPKEGIDFRGGTVTTFSYEADFTLEDLTTQLSELLPFNETEYNIYNENDSFILETYALSEEERKQLQGILTVNDVEPEITSYTTISPTIGSELERKSIIAMVIASLVIILYVAFAFRRVSYKVQSWKYGLVSIITLAFDILIPITAFAILSQFTIARLDILVVTAILAIIGYSINDTIVVLDRVRENLQKEIEKGREIVFEKIVAQSVSQSLHRSIYTSLTTVLAVLAIYILGGEVTQWFSLTLLIGVIVGTYSSLFLASPLLIIWEKRGEIKEKGKMSEYEKAEQELLERLK